MNDTSYRFGAGRYLQEQVLENSGEEIKRYGKRPYVIGGENALRVTKDRMIPSLDQEGLLYTVEVYNGYPSVEKIEQLQKDVENAGCDMLVGVGGGRIMDLVKAVAANLSLPVVLVPTSAATCAAFSPLSVLYTPEGKSHSYIHFEYEVNAVLVDDAVMLTQPARLLAAGILDAMAKYIEIETLHPEVLDEHTSIARHSAFHMAKYTYDVLKVIGPQAVKDLEAGVMTKTLHDVIYINIALTGIVSGMMQGKGQTALAHALNSGLRKQFLEQTRPWLHGEVVALGMLAQLVYNGQEERTDELKEFMRQFQMPCSLQEMAMDMTEDELEKLADCLAGYPFMIHDETHEMALKKSLMAIQKG